jgi:hypothetical protein
MAQNTYLGAHWGGRRQWDGLLYSGFSFVNASLRCFPPPCSFEDQAACFMIAIEESFMKLKFVAAFFALAIPALAHAQQSGPNVPKPTKADAQNVVQIITSDKVKTQAYCDLDKLEGQVKAAEQKNDAKTLEALSEQAQSLIDKLGPEYFKLMDGLEKVDPNSSEAKEFMSILSELDKRCTN